MIITLDPITPVGVTPGIIDWWKQAAGRDDACDLKLANYSPNALRLTMAGQSHWLEPWMANKFPVTCLRSALYSQIAVSSVAALPAGSTASLIATVSFGEEIPGIYPVPLYGTLPIDINAGDVQQLALAAVAGTTGLAADAGHQHPEAIIYAGPKYNYDLQAAINALPAGGGTVIMASGRTYNPLASIVPGQDNVNIIGAGWGSIINMAAGVTYGVDFSSRQRCLLANCVIQQSGNTSPSVGFRLGPGSQRNRADHVLCIAAANVAGQSGVTFDSNAVGGSFWNVLTDVWTNGFNVSFDLTSTGAQNQNDNQLLGCKSQACQIGLALGGATGLAGANYIAGHSFDSYSAYAIDVGAAARGNIVRGAYFEGLAATTPVRFQAGSKNNDFDGLELSSPLGANTIVDNSGAGSGNNYSFVIVSPGTETVVKAFRREGRRVIIQPTADGGEVFQLMNAAGTTHMDYASNAPEIDFPNSIPLKGYSDNFVTQRWLIRASDGYAQFLGGVGLETVGHNHGHTHGAHSHAHTATHTHGNTAGGGTTTGASAGTAHTHGYNDPLLAGFSGTAAPGTSDNTTPANDATGESATHTHQG